MSRLVLVALLALCITMPALGDQSTRESLEDSEKPPQEFPKDKALKYDASRVPTPKTPLEVPDMTGDNDTEPVKHPNVSDPGTTHAEGTEGNGGSIHACALPDMHERNSSASTWLADTGNVTKVCHLPLKSLHGATGNVRVCSIPKDAWNSSYTVVDGTIAKELLAELNTSSVKCVTPSEALSNSSSIAEDDSISNGSLPSAWLRSNDTIYIYIIPQEWLRKTQQASPDKASEVEDLTKDPLDVSSSTPSPVGSTSASAAAAVNSTAAPSGDSTATIASTSVDSNSTGAGNVTGKPITSIDNSTEASSPANTTATTVATPIVKNTESSPPASTSTHAPAVVSDVPVGTTEKPKEVTPKPTDSLKETTTAKSAEQPKEDIVKTTTKPKEEVTKTTEKPALVVTKKPEESSSKKPNQETTDKPNDIGTPEEHSVKDNEIEHKVPSPQPPEALSQQHSEHNHANSGKTAFLQPTESAAILAGVFVAIALLGYAGLLLWRRVLEKRYGNREMLVNEDDDFDTSDMRHFEL